MFICMADMDEFGRDSVVSQVHTGVRLSGLLGISGDCRLTLSCFLELRDRANLLYGQRCQERIELKVSQKRFPEACCKGSHKDNNSDVRVPGGTSIKFDPDKCLSCACCYRER